VVGGGGAFDPLDETNRAAPHPPSFLRYRGKTLGKKKRSTSCGPGGRVAAALALTRANVRDALDARRRKYAMDACETLQRLTDHARASIGDFLDDACTIDLKMADEQGKLPLVNLGARQE
jgi:hypothetical protein